MPFLKDCNCGKNKKTIKKQISSGFSERKSNNHTKRAADVFSQRKNSNQKGFGNFRRSGNVRYIK